MATQVKFYSTTAASYSAIESKDAGGVYFVNGGELYKGTSRFGANKIYQLTSNYSIGDISGQIGGDIAIGDGWTKAWNGSAWVQIENDVQIKTMVSLMTAGLVSGNSNSYITHITQDENGNVTAHAQAFPTLNLSSSTVSSSANGVIVSVTTESGAVTGVSVSATDISCNSVSAASGTFTDLAVTSTANFSVTNVSATTLTIGGSTVEQLADKQIAAIPATTVGSTSNGITVSVTTSGGSVNAVTLNASAFGNVMKFRGVVASTTSISNPASGDIVIIGSQPTGGAVAGQEYIYDGSKWELIGDQATYATKADLVFKASVGSSAAASYGMSASISLTSDAAPSIYLTGPSVINASAGVASASQYLVTGKAVKEYVDSQALVWLDASGSAIS